MLHTVRSGLIIALGVLTLGCSSSAKRAQTREDASVAYQEGLVALESGNFSAAVEKLSLALDSGWLGYTKVNGYLKRAIAHAALGDFEAAQADLEMVERGGGDSDEYYAIQSYIYEKQGKQKEAKVAWAKARKLNRGVKKIEY